MKLAIASDHNGFKLKEEIINKLREEYDINDLGTYSEESCDYPDYAFKLGDEVSNNNADFGIAICGSGIGISIACNKVKGIRCAKVSNIEEAEKTRIDNDSNVIAISSKIEAEDAINMILKFITTSFSQEERHQRRINKIKEYEENN